MAMEQQKHQTFVVETVGELIDILSAYDRNQKIAVAHITPVDVRAEPHAYVPELYLNLEAHR